MFNFIFSSLSELSRRPLAAIVFTIAGLLNAMFSHDWLSLLWVVSSLLGLVSVYALYRIGKEQANYIKEHRRAVAYLAALQEQCIPYELIVDDEGDIETIRVRRDKNES